MEWKNVKRDIPLSLRGLLGFDENSSSLERNNLIALKTYKNKRKKQIINWKNNEHTFSGFFYSCYKNYPKGRT